MGAAIVCDDMTGVPEFGFETSAMLTSSVRRRIKRSLLKMKKEVERRSQREVGVVKSEVETEFKSGSAYQSWQDLRIRVHEPESSLTK